MRRGTGALLGVEAAGSANIAKLTRGIAWELGKNRRAACTETCDVREVEKLWKRGTVNKSCVLVHGSPADL